jgi:hypothetical protein
LNLMRVMPPKGGAIRRQFLSHPSSSPGFMKEPVISTDSLSPDYTDSEETNLRKSPASSNPAKATTQSADESSSLPNSRKVYLSGKIQPDIRVPFREISLAPTKTMSGEIEMNEPVRVYDTSGPWGDPTVTVDAYQGLPALRRKWILARGDVEEYEGRIVQPIDDGFLSEKHAAIAAQRSTPNGEKGNAAKVSGFRFQGSGKKVLGGKSHPVTQLWYARQGIITPEMEFIALRENMGREAASEPRTLNPEPFQLPTRVADAGDHSLVGQFAEANATNAKFLIHGPRPATQAATVLATRTEFWLCFRFGNF